MHSVHVNFGILTTTSQKAGKHTQHSTLLFQHLLSSRTLVSRNKCELVKTELGHEVAGEDSQPIEEKAPAIPD